MGAEKSVIYEHHFSVAVWECSSAGAMKTQGGTSAGTGGMKARGLH